MKLLATILIATFLVQGIAAYPKPLFGDIFKEIADGANKVGSVVGGIVSGVLGGVGELVQGFVNTTEDLVSGMLNATVTMMNKVAEDVEAITEGIYHRVADVAKDTEEAVAKLLKFGNDKTKDVANEIKKRVEDINGKVKEMMGEVEKKFDEGMKKVNASIDESNAKITNMVNELKEKYKDAKVSEEDKKKIDELIEGFVTKNSEDMSTCANEIVEPMKSLHEEAQTAINGILPTVEGAIKDLTQCLKDAGTEHSKMAECAEKAQSSLPNISNMEEFAKKVQTEIDNFKLDDIVDMTCMEETLNHIQKRKDELDQEIGKIVEKKE